ncbi:MAG: hypothetical protein IKS35_03505 [Clostridia bacterium]|nr:hypothetical protein [Clostridia bacterium]
MPKKSQRLTAFLLLFLLFCLCLAGCGSKKDSETTPSDPQATETGAEQDEEREKINANPPSVVFNETPVTRNGARYEIVTANVGTPDGVRYMEVAQRSSFLFVHWRDDDTNKLRLGLDETVRSSFAGKLVSLLFEVYVQQKATITVEYTTADGQTAKSSGQSSETDCWTQVMVQLDTPALTGAFDGYDFYVTLEGPELIRVHEILFTLGTDRYTNTPLLRESQWLTDAYLVSVCDVVYFGAVGDGITDDSDAFQAALNYAGTKGGGAVFVPVGQYALKKPIIVPDKVSLVGDLEPGTANGSTLFILHGSNSTDIQNAAVQVYTQSAVKNLVFYYPDQSIESGSAVPYPPTILQKSMESITLSNLYFVNAYTGIDCATDHANLSLQHIYQIYGCTLHKGYWNNESWDITRVEDIYFSPDYWLKSGYPAPAEGDLREYCLRNATGLHLQHIDWTYISDIHIRGYHTGILANQGYSPANPNVVSGQSNGHLYNLDFEDCFYGLYGGSFSWFQMTNCKIHTVDENDAAAIRLLASNSGTLSMNTCDLKGGKHAVINEGQGLVTFGSCKLESCDTVFVSRSARYSMLNTTTGSDPTDYGNVNVQDSLTYDYDSIRYRPSHSTRPASAAFIDLSGRIESGKDISQPLQAAIDALRGQGGTVFIPGGWYALNSPVTVWEGIEVRGAGEGAAAGGAATNLQTDYGRGNENGQALITLKAGAGLRGLRILYPKVVQESDSGSSFEPYAFTVRGEGEKLYLINVALTSSYNGVDFASSRCDEHYVQYLWGCPIHIGIEVGANSTGGIIRDVQYTPNCFGGNWQNVYTQIMSRARCFYIHDCNEEVLFHNFTYAGWHGLEINEGAHGVKVISHGTDSGNCAVYIGGDCTAVLIDSQLVNLPGGTPDHRAYIFTDDTFTGSVRFINTSEWGSTIEANEFCGNGTVEFCQGTIPDTAATTFQVKGGLAKIYGTDCASASSCDVDLYDQAKDAVVVGNIFRARPGVFRGVPDEHDNK